MPTPTRSLFFLLATDVFTNYRIRFVGREVA